MAPGQLGEHNARGTPCPESAACPAPRHTAGPARSHHLRSKRNATREPGGLGRFGAARGRTRTVSAGTTRTTNPARSRQHALPPRRTAGSPRSHRLRSVRSATREPGAAGPYGACGAGPSCGVKALRQGRARAAQAAHVPWVAASPMAHYHEPAGTDEQPARRSTVHGACTPPKRCRWVAQGRSDGTTSARAGAAWRDRVLLGCPEGAKTRIEHKSARGRKRALGSLLSS